MKIHIVTLDFTLSGGIERVVSLLANGFISMGYQVQITSIFKRFESPKYNVSPEVSVIYENYSGFDNSNRCYYKYIMMFKSLRKLYKLSDNDTIILSTLLNLSVMLAVIKFIFGKRTSSIIACEHSQYLAHNVCVRMLRKLTYPLLDFVVVLTCSDMEKFSKFIPPNKLGVIPNPNLYTSIEPESELRSKRIVTIGRLHPVKGYDKLIVDVAEFLSKRTDWRMEIYGEGDEFDSLNQLISELDMEHNIFLMGFHKDILEQIKGSSIYVCSSFTEAFPMSFLDALSVGLPIISYDCPVGPREIIVNGKNGYLIDFDDSFSEYVEMISKNEDIYNELSKNSFESSKNYDIKNIIPQWLDVIGKVKSC